MWTTSALEDEAGSGVTPAPAPFDLDGLPLILTPFCTFCADVFSHSGVSDSLQPYGLQHARLPCPSPSPGVCSHSCTDGGGKKNLSLLKSGHPSSPVRGGAIQVIGDLGKGFSGN